MRKERYDKILEIMIEKYGNEIKEFAIVLIMVIIRILANNLENLKESKEIKK